MFERYGPVAERAKCGMLTAFGYDWVPGNLAGGLALERAGDRAVRVDTGYFFTGAADPKGMSGGTRASLAGIMGAPSFVYRDGIVSSERGAKRLRTFALGSREASAVSVGSSEHYTLPRLAPNLREVNSYLGWFGPASRAMQVTSGGLSLAMKLPGVEQLWEAASSRLVKGSTGGPDAEARGRGGSHIVGIAYDASGQRPERGAPDRRGRLHLHGQDPGLGRRTGRRRRPARDRGARSRRRLRPRGAHRRLRRGRDRRGGKPARRARGRGSAR